MKPDERSFYTQYQQKRLELATEANHHLNRIADALETIVAIDYERQKK